MSGDIHVRSYTRKREPRITARTTPHFVLPDAKREVKQTKRNLKEAKQELKNAQLEAKANIEEARSNVRKAKVDVQDARLIVQKLKRGELAPTVPAMAARPITAVTSQFKRLEEE